MSDIIIPKVVEDMLENPKKVKQADPQLRDFVIKQCDRIELLPSQIPFFATTKREILLSGGFGSGKSLALCVKLVQEATIKGNLVLLVRKHLTSLKRSTLRMLIEPEGDRPPILPQGTYTHNKVEGRIEIIGGGTILYTGCDEPQKIRSINAGSIFVDEVSEISDTEYEELLLRLRMNVGSLKLYSCTNPSTKAHFLYDRFVMQDNSTRQIVYCNSLENYHLPEEMLTQLKSYTGDTYAHRVEGKWVNDEKLIYPSFDYQKHVMKNHLMNKYKNNIISWYIGLDYGYVNPTAILLVGVDGDRNIYVFDEFYQTRCKNADIKTNIAKTSEEYDINRVIVDPSAAALIDDIASEGHNAQKANNAVDIGINRLRDYFDTNKIIISDNCPSLISELGGYGYDDSGKIMKIKDHACDALRYVGNELAGVWADEATAPKTWLVCV